MDSSLENIIPFPSERVRPKEIAIDPLEEVLFEVEVVEHASAATPPLQQPPPSLEENLPPFVVKMRQLSALSQEISAIETMALKIDYLLGEIDEITARQNRYSPKGIEVW